MGGVNNIIVFDINDVNIWSWLCLVNIKDVSNCILINQINIILIFDIGLIGYDVSVGVEFIWENQINYGVNVRIVLVVNFYYLVSNLLIGGLDRNGVNVNGQIDIFGIYVFDMLMLIEWIEINGGLCFDNYYIKYDSVIVCGGSGCGVIVCLFGQLIGSLVIIVDIVKFGNLVNWKVGVLYCLIEQGNVYVNYVILQQLLGGSSFVLVVSGSGNSVN